MVAFLSRDSNSFMNLGYHMIKFIFFPPRTKINTMNRKIWWLSLFLIMLHIILKRINNLENYGLFLDYDLFMFL